MSHFSIFTEDISGKKMLDILLPKLVFGRDDITFDVKSYKGVGNVPPKGKKTDVAAIKARMLLDNLGRILKGLGKVHAGNAESYRQVVIVVCDLDKRDKTEFLNQLNAILSACDPQPVAHFCLAIEEGEAWLLGDIPAIRKAYPKCKKDVLDRYINDSICGTWEHLANALEKGGAESLKKSGYSAVGKAKSEWAEKIAPQMDVEHNQSPSFRYFRDTLRECAGVTAES